MLEEGNSNFNKLLYVLHVKFILAGLFSLLAFGDCSGHITLPMPFELLTHIIRMELLFAATTALVVDCDEMKMPPKVPRVRKDCSITGITF